MLMGLSCTVNHEYASAVEIGNAGTTSSQTSSRVLSSSGVISSPRPVLPPGRQRQRKEHPIQACEEVGTFGLRQP